MSKSYTFSRASRLLTPQDFKIVFNQAHKLNFSSFMVYVMENGRGKSRLGLAVSKKSAKKAVTRNQIKRIIRDSFRLRQDELKGWDIVFVSRASANNISKADLNALTQRVWRRISSC